jgi:DNA-directed RNA polymerase subunit L
MRGGFLELELISKDKNMLEFYIKGERHSLPNLLKSRIEKEPSVEFVSYRLEHPLDDKARFVVKSSGKKEPVKIIEAACSDIEKEFREFSDKVRKLKL